MLNKDDKDMLQSLADEQVKFLLVGAYALDTPKSATPLPRDLQTDHSEGER